jgi:hypothetical protein
VLFNPMKISKKVKTLNFSLNILLGILEKLLNIFYSEYPN